MSDERLDRALARFTQDWGQHGYGLAMIRRGSSDAWTAVAMVYDDTEVACASSPDLAVAVEDVMGKLQKIIALLRESAEKEEA